MESGLVILCLLIIKQQPVEETLWETRTASVNYLPRLDSATTSRVNLCMCLLVCGVYHAVGTRGILLMCRTVPVNTRWQMWRVARAVLHTGLNVWRWEPGLTGTPKTLSAKIIKITCTGP